jgi:hypothetical protein
VPDGFFCRVSLKPANQTEKQAVDEPVHGLPSAPADGRADAAVQQGPEYEKRDYPSIAPAFSPTIARTADAQ